MSESKTIARPYASACFDVAQETGNTDDWLLFLEAAAEVVVINSGSWTTHGRLAVKSKGDSNGDSNQAVRWPLGFTRSPGVFQGRPLGE